MSEGGLRVYDGPGPRAHIDRDDVSEREALALVLYMLFGPKGTLDVSEGGYMEWNESGRMSAGILEQIDKRMVRLEELHDLEPLRFIVDEEEESARLLHQRPTSVVADVL